MFDETWKNIDEKIGTVLNRWIARNTAKESHMETQMEQANETAPMTEVQGIMDVKAGAALDQMIAEQVFTNTVQMLEDGTYPKWSTDLNTSMQVVDRLRNHFTVEIKTTGTNAYLCHITDRGNRYDAEVGAESTSLAEAICLAAIEAVTSL